MIFFSLKKDFVFTRVVKIHIFLYTCFFVIDISILMCHIMADHFGMMELF